MERDIAVNEGSEGEGVIGLLVSQRPIDPDPFELVRETYIPHFQFSSRHPSLQFIASTIDGALFSKNDNTIATRDRIYSVSMGRNNTGPMARSPLLLKIRECVPNMMLEMDTTQKLAFSNILKYVFSVIVGPRRDILATRCFAHAFILPFSGDEMPSRARRFKSHQNQHYQKPHRDHRLHKDLRPQRTNPQPVFPLPPTCARSSPAANLAPHHHRARTSRYETRS